MSWNFRVLRHRVEEPGGETSHYYSIHEAYYLDKDNPQEPTSHTKNPVHVGGTSVEDLRWVLEQMLKALDKPVLNYDREEEPFDEKSCPGPSSGH